MHGRYPDYDCLEGSGHWDELTRSVVVKRIERVPQLRFFNEAEAATLEAFCDVVLAQDSRATDPCTRRSSTRSLRRRAWTAISTPTCPMIV